MCALPAVGRCQVLEHCRVADVVEGSFYIQGQDSLRRGSGYAVEDVFLELKQDIALTLGT